MALKDSVDLTRLINEAENLVIEELENQLNENENSSICACEDCILDMIALTLNNLQPAYRSSYTGLVYAQELQSDKNKDLYKKEVKKAIEKVKKNPSHD